MQIEDPIDPSCRLKGMSWDFTYLIEDPITDIQLFPAQIMRLSKPRAYLESYWSDFKPRSHIVAGLFFPSVMHGVGVGILYNYYLYKWSSNNSNVTLSQTMEYSKQHPSLFIGLPFLKQDGFLALKCSYFFDQDHINTNAYWDYDTLETYEGDTSTTHWSYNSFSHSKYEKPQWRFSLNQYLPTDDSSSINIALEFCSYYNWENDYDTLLNNQYDTTIYYSGPLRYVYSVTQMHKDYQSYISDQTLPSGFITAVFNNNKAWGKLRFLGRVGLAKGGTDSQSELISNDTIIDKEEYIFPDTQFVYIDTFLYNDMIKDLIHKDQLYLSAIIGAGGIFPVKNGNILSGIKFSYYQDRLKQDKDSLNNCYQTYLTSVSIGSELNINKYLCLRDGLNIYLEYDILESRHNEAKYKYTEHYFGCDGAIGFGLKPASHVQLDFYTYLYIEELFDSWAIDAVYDF